MKVFIAGFQHETNTFGPSKADWAAFHRGESFPPYRRGEAVIKAYAGRNIPIGGFISAAREQGWSLVPSAWAGATPTEDLSAALAQDDLDAVYLDLHGAAVAEHLEDPEGELLSRIRKIVGPDRPIVASLDLHANVTRRMLAEADADAMVANVPNPWQVSVIADYKLSKRTDVYLTTACVRNAGVNFDTSAVSFANGYYLGAGHHNMMAFAVGLRHKF